jgi:hypothetical protein
MVISFTISNSEIDWPAMKERVKACMLALLARLSARHKEREKLQGK